jgi:hypothetical protein
MLGTHCGSIWGKSRPQKYTINVGVVATHDLKEPTGFPRSHGILQEICTPLWKNC